MDPVEWICAAFGVGDAAKNFKVLQIGPKDPRGALVRVLHKESGAVWSFRCKIVKEGVA